MIYALSMLELSAVIACYFAFARSGFRTLGKLQWPLCALAALPLLISGTAHLLRPAAMAFAIPPVFPARTLLVVLSGICEAAGAVGLLLPRWRRSSAFCVALLMVAVFPVNIYIAGQTLHGLHMPGVKVRLAMQAGYILLVMVAGWGWPMLRVRRSSI